MSDPLPVSVSSGDEVRGRDFFAGGEAERRYFDRVNLYSVVLRGNRRAAGRRTLGGKGEHGNAMFTRWRGE